MNPKKKPDYDPQVILADLCATAVSLYKENKSLRQIADELGLNPIKVRKLLITEGVLFGQSVYCSDVADEVLALHKDGKSVKEIMALTNMSAASVNSYFPYTKAVYKAEECSVLADRIRLYRERKAAVEKLMDTGSEADLWSCIIFFAGYPFHTSKGLEFQYTVKGNEMFVDRKEKSITRASVVMAYERAVEMNGIVPGPKKLGVFGASYLYPVLVRFGVIKKASPESQKSKSKQSESQTENNLQTKMDI